MGQPTDCKICILKWSGKSYLFFLMMLLTAESSYLEMQSKHRKSMSPFDMSGVAVVVLENLSAVRFTDDGTPVRTTSMLDYLF
jgi:hypothetical protein